MTFNFLCPICDERIGADEELIGVRVNCPDCGALLSVPEPPQLRHAEEAAQELVAEEVPLDFSDKEPIEAEMDMTPMVDVTFLLLIFFMVTASFTLQKSIQIPIPETDQASTNPQTIEDIEDDPDYVTVRIDSNNTYRVIAEDWDEEAPSKQDLIITLKRAQQLSSSGNIANHLLVIAHGDARHATVVAALDAGAIVAMDSIKLTITEQDEEE